MKRKTAAKKKPPKKSVRTFKVENLVYQYALFVRVGDTRDAAMKWFERKFGTDGPKAADAASGTTFIKIGELSHLIWFCEKPGAGLVAHEALHSVKHVLHTVGLGPLTDDTEEAYAYLLGWTVEQIGGRLWRK